MHQNIGFKKKGDYTAVKSWHLEQFWERFCYFEPDWDVGLVAHTVSHFKVQLEESGCFTPHVLFWESYGYVSNNININETSLFYNSGQGFFSVQTAHANMDSHHWC